MICYLLSFFVSMFLLIRAIAHIGDRTVEDFDSSDWFTIASLSVLSPLGIVIGIAYWLSAFLKWATRVKVW